MGNNIKTQRINQFAVKIHEKIVYLFFNIYMQSSRQVKY